MQAKNLSAAGALLSLGVLAGGAMAQSTPGAPPVNAGAKPRLAASAQVVPAVTTAPRAAQVQVVDDDAHAPYQEGGLTNCTFAGVCTVGFSLVPAGHRHVIEHFSCSVYVPAPGVPRYVALLSNQFSLPRDFSALSRSPADPAQWFVNNATLLHFEAGEAPVAYAFADSGPIQELFCTVSGRDIVLP